MHRFIVIALVAVASCLGLAGSAAAQDPDPAVPPAFAPPGPAPVVDEATAENFAKAFAARNAGRFLRSDRRRVRVIDAKAKCLQSPVLASRYGCVFSLRALVITRTRGWDGWDHHGDKPTAAPASRRGGDHGDHGDHGRKRFRISTRGCLGFLRLNVGVGTPSVSVLGVECGRVPRGDLVAPEPV